MELKIIDNSRVIYLTQARRRAGQMFLPAVIEGFVSRYHFQKIPTAEEMLGNSTIFQMGLFEGVGISEFAVYNDGVIATSRANTDVLYRFIQDVLLWAKEEWDITETNVPPRECHYESNLIVEMDLDASRTMPFLNNLNAMLAKAHEEYGLRPFQFEFAALQVGNDPLDYGGKRPIPFTVIRRVSVPFEDNIYFCTAPLKTDDHVAALKALEKDLTG